jgi:uncharacterized protein (DUF1810 family)
MEDSFDLERFVAAQDATVLDGRTSFDVALGELRQGRKTTHWVWWVFPQLAGLGGSPTSRRFAISSLEEARAYLRHPILGPRLRDSVIAMNAHEGRSAHEILNGDDVKFRSCLTLFMRADPNSAIFRTTLARLFHAEPDPVTDQLLGPTDPA